MMQRFVLSFVALVFFFFVLAVILHLAVQVALVDHIVVHNADAAKACSGQVPVKQCFSSGNWQQSHFTNSDAGHPRPPAPTTRTPARFSFSWPARPSSGSRSCRPYLPTKGKEKNNGASLKINAFFLFSFFSEETEQCLHC